MMTKKSLSPREEVLTANLSSSAKAFWKRRDNGHTPQVALRLAAYQASGNLSDIQILKLVEKPQVLTKRKNAAKKKQHRKVYRIDDKKECRAEDEGREESPPRVRKKPTRGPSLLCGLGSLSFSSLLPSVGVSTNSFPSFSEVTAALLGMPEDPVREASPNTTTTA
eukprot:GHVS01039086.1.p1 GENE.GHVS01039086.1~~GHVS01039086.1.p1  ORF type:complete len:166 (+),score=30.45 GHVS01039086.1:664-1161(+)